MMGPFAALESVVFNSFSFRGRATRAEYWWFWLFCTLASLGAVFSDGMRMNAGQPSINPLSYAIVWLTLLTFIPFLSVTIRRLHDSGRSGFWYLLIFVPVVGPLILLVLMLAPSDSEDNEFGVPHMSVRRKGLSDASIGRPTPQKRDPMQAYAILDQSDEQPTPEMIEARKQQIHDYYRSRVAPGAAKS